MINLPPDELFAERPVRSDFARRGGGPSYRTRRFITLAALVAVACLGLYLVFGYSSSSTIEEIPTIKAEGSYKQRPEQPGGLDIPHQDVQVYQSIIGNTSSSKPPIERLLPPPETPQALLPQQSNKSAVLEAMQQPESLAPENIPAKPVATNPSLTSSVSTTVMPAPEPAPQAHVEKATEISPKSVVPPAPVPTETKPTPTIEDVLKNVTASKEADSSPKSGPSVQLASIPDQAAAQQAMEKLQTKYSAVLSGTKLRLVKADLGTKGVYYRIQSQPLTEEKAKSLCSALKNLNAGCILVRP